MKRFANLTVIIPLVTELVEHIALCLVDVAKEITKAVKDSLDKIKNAWAGE